MFYERGILLAFFVGCDINSDISGYARVVTQSGKHFDEVMREVAVILAQRRSRWE